LFDLDLHNFALQLEPILIANLSNLLMVPTVEVLKIPVSAPLPGAIDSVLGHHTDRSLSPSISWLSMGVSRLCSRDSPEAGGSELIATF